MPNDNFRRLARRITRALDVVLNRFTVPLKTLLGGNDLRIRIGKERAYELLGEGHEWFDLRRIKNGAMTFLESQILRRQDLMTGADLFDTKNKTKFHNVWNPDLSIVIGSQLIKNYYFPIPTNEIIGNNKLTNADQNPGY